jgi:hypothetical protein
MPSKVGKKGYAEAHPEERLTGEKFQGRHEILPETDKRKPWYRQPGESRIAYEAFCMFLTIPEPRTYKKVGEAVGKSLQQITRWGRHWNWQLRAAAYSEHHLLLRLESTEAERERMYNEHRTLARQGQAIVEKHFEIILDALKEDEQGQIDIKGMIKPDALVRLFDAVTKVERMSVLGQIDDREKTAEEREALQERYATELADLFKGLMDDLQLSPQQKQMAKAAFAKRFVGAD